MAEEPDIDHERVIDALLLALGEQSTGSEGGRVAPSVIARLAREHRSVLRVLLGCAGHLIHYGDDVPDAPLEGFVLDLTQELRTVNSPGPGGLLPGDTAEMLSAQPDDRLRSGEEVRVAYVGEDGTADVHPIDDYVLLTVSVTQLKRRTT